MIKIKQFGRFDKLEEFLKRSRKKSRITNQATLLAEACVDELKKVTPKDSGLTSESWDYEINVEGKRTSIVFFNKNIQNGLNIALLLEYGHGTSTGGWVEGKEYIDPVIQKYYLDVVSQKWKEMCKL